MTYKQQTEEVKRYLHELIEVSRRHNMSLSHEDNHGAFIVEKFTEDNAHWLLTAFNEIED